MSITKATRIYEIAISAFSSTAAEQFISPSQGGEQSFSLYPSVGFFLLQP